MLLLLLFLDLLILDQQNHLMSFANRYWEEEDDEVRMGVSHSGPRGPALDFIFSRWTVSSLWGSSAERVHSSTPDSSLSALCRAHRAASPGAETAQKVLVELLVEELLEPLKQRRVQKKCQSSAPLLSLTASPHEAESLLNTVTKPSVPCSALTSSLPPSCSTEQRYLYVWRASLWTSKMATVRPDSLSSSCSPSAGSHFSWSSFRLSQEKRTRGGNMAEATHSRELLPSRWALDAAGYTLTTGFTTCSSEVWQQQQAAQTHIDTVNSSLQHCTAFSVILETTWTLITKLLINTAQSSTHRLDSPASVGQTILGFYTPRTTPINDTIMRNNCLWLFQTISDVNLLTITFTLKF